MADTRQLDNKEREAWERCVRSSPACRQTVHTIENGLMREPDAMKKLAVVLIRDNEALMKMCAKLLVIVPRRYEMPGGEVLRWDVQDEMVQVEKLK